MGTKQPAEPPKQADPIATPDEVRQAVASLTEAELYRLEEVADAAAYRLPRKARPVEGADLLQEAVVRLLRRARRWKPGKVDLAGQIAGTIKSIASEIREWAERGATPVLECDLLLADPEGETRPSIIQDTPDTRPNPEEQLLSKEQITVEQLLLKVEELFAEDPPAAFILSELRRGSSSREIMEALGFTRQQYDTITRRIYRMVRRHWPEGMPDVS